MSFDSYFQSNAKEIIKDKLYWISADRTPKNLPKSFFINVDNDLVYEPLSSDFGPLDIGKTVRFVMELKKLLDCPQFADSKIYHHTSTDFAKRANAAFLMGAFQVIILGKTAQEAWAPLSTVQPAFVPFRDALDGSCSYKCTILDCLQGLEFAMQLKWFDINKFDLKCYEALSKLDVNWIIPGKILAFSAPSSQPKDAEGYKRFVPEDYTTSFKKLGVKSIIQLNSKDYDEKRFTQMGFRHHNIEMSGTQCPGDRLVDKFMSLCEEEKGVIAVHCKTGLGCSGTMIACFAMKYYNFPAASLIGWMRLCRPGSILGQQQQFLVKNEDSLCQKWITACEVASSIDLDSHQEVVCQQQPYVFKCPKLTPLKELKMEDLKRMS